MDKTKTNNAPDTSGLDVYGRLSRAEDRLPDSKSAHVLYDRCRQFNTSINLDETVRMNENFYIGKQWEGVVSNGLPTPQFNFLKRVACFTVANICTNDIKVTAFPLAASPNTESLTEPVRIVNEELEALTDRNEVQSLMREFAINAAIDGDGCLYTYWDADAETGQDAKGAIKTEVLQNTRVYFGNPNNAHVQEQPYIIIESRAEVRDVKDRAQDNGCPDWEKITPDNDNTGIDSAKVVDNKVTLLLLLWRDKKTREIWGYELTEQSSVRPAWNLGIKLYPLVWLNWDRILDSYHGQAMITGLLPNQIFVNKTWAMTQRAMMMEAFSKIIYDKSRIHNWDNAIGHAIGIHGNVNDAVKTIDPAPVSPQIAQYLTLAVEQTEQTLGATNVALGDTRPDNAAAVIALQRAAATPSEMTKKDLYKAIKDMYRIYVDFMGVYYGKRYVDIDTPPELQEAAAFSGKKIPDQIPVMFDFDAVKQIALEIKMDVGAGTYYSEMASVQTLDNLLRMNQINILQYLERIPDGQISGRQALVNEIKGQQLMQQMQTPPLPGSPQPGAEPSSVTPPPKMPIPTGGGYSALQRKINDTGTTEGVA